MRLNREQLDKLFTKDNDKVIFNGNSCIVTINKRYETFGLFNVIESGINTLAIFNMHIDGEDYGYILPAVVNMKPSLIEEERRLFYVAMTRAEKNLFILRPKRVMINGFYQQSRPSRFIGEINTKYLYKN